jgi:hypothetical protein
LLSELSGVATGVFEFERNVEGKEGMRPDMIFGMCRRDGGLRVAWGSIVGKVVSPAVEGVLVVS